MNNHLFIILLLSFCTSFHTMAQKADRSKMSSFVRQIEMEHRHSLCKSTSSSSAHEHSLCAFVKASDSSALKDNGCEILASFINIHIALIPLSHLSSLSVDHRVMRIEAGRSCNTTNDIASSMVGVNVLRNPSSSELQPLLKPEGYTGRGVVFGIQDIAFDLTHPTFYSKDMATYRIRRFWDQLEIDDDKIMPVGREFTTEDDILKKGCAYDGHIEYHGTHTTGTGAGSGYNSPYTGMAPDADICLVANATGNNSSLIPEERKELYTSAMDALGFKYIFDYAESIGKPCVINFSEGGHSDLYGDDKLMNEVIGEMTGNGKILVASAGNEGYILTFLPKPKGKASAGAYISSSKNYAYYTAKSAEHASFILAYEENGTTTPITINTFDVFNSEESETRQTFNVGDREYTLFLATYESCEGTGEWVTEILLKASDEKSIPSSVFSLVLSGEEQDIEIYSSGGYFQNKGSLSDADYSHCILSPGSLSSVICVGGTNSRTSITNEEGTTFSRNWGEIGQYGGFSSIGPSMEGLTKPDVSAPGCLILSSISSFYLEDHPNQWIISPFTHNDRKYAWTASGGTSMASPVVAGTIALWLEACPTLSPSQVMDVIANTSSKPSDYYSYPIIKDINGIDKNNYYGYGVIDAKAGMEYILTKYSAGIESPLKDSSNSSAPIYNLMGIKISSPLPGSIYIQGGKKIRR